MASNYVKERLKEINAQVLAETIAREQRAAEAWRINNINAAAYKAKMAVRKERRPGYVYFLRSGNAAKIGFTTDPTERLSKLRTGCAEPAKIVKLVRGTRSTEKAFHLRFAEYRMKGEWFELRGGLAKYLERCLKEVELPVPIVWEKPVIDL